MIDVTDTIDEPGPRPPSRGPSALARGAIRWSLARRRTLASHGAALADQSIVSAASFATTVMIGRWTSPSELGVYSIAITILLMWVTTQEALISLPYALRRQGMHASPELHAGAALLQSGALSALSAVVLLGSAVLLGVGGTAFASPALLPALAMVVPCVLTREFLRSFAFARMRPDQAFLLDASVAVLQIGLLGLLHLEGSLTAVTALGALAAACGIAGLLSLVLLGAEFKFSAVPFREAAADSWMIGGWLFGNQMTIAAQGYATASLLALESGMSATGIYSASMSVALLANPLIMGLNNLLAPRSALTLAEQGPRALFTKSVAESVVLGAMTAVFCAVVALGGEAILALLYRNDAYSGHALVATILSLALLAMALGMPATNGLTSLRQPRLVFLTGLAGAAVNITILAALLPEWGPLGAAWGFLAGNLARAFGRWLLFVRLTGRSDLGGVDLQASYEPVRTDVLQVLRSACPDVELNETNIHRLHEGVQSTTFAVQLPAHFTAQGLVVKMYRHNRGQDAAIILAQHKALDRLHRLVDGVSSEGWRVSIPCPVFVAEEHLALGMTLAPGEKLSALLGARSVPDDMARALARAVVAALQRCWSAGLVHGDLAFHNILVDAESRRISLIDVGVHSTFFPCESVPRDWHPCAHDLAHVLYDVGVCIDSSTSRAAAGGMEAFAEEAVRTALQLVRPAEREAVAGQIRACASIHVDALPRSWRPSGIWHMVLRRIAYRRIGSVLAKAGLPPGPTLNGRAHWHH